MTVERSGVETRLQTPNRISYSEIIHGVVGHEQLTPEQRIDIDAVDKMVGTIREDSVFAKSFLENHNLTIGDKGRLTDRSNPDYMKDLLWSVHNPEELYVAVIINGPEKYNEDTHEISDEHKHVQEWGRRMLRLATEVNEDDDIATKLAKRRMGNLVEKEGAHFDIDFNPLTDPTESVVAS